MMSDSGNTAGSGSGFESELSKADTKVATFDGTDVSFLQKLRALLHTYPTAVPVCVLAPQFADVWFYGG